MNVRVTRDEEGASLLLALIFLTVMSIVVSATLSLADVDFRHTVAVRDDRKVVYAADAAMDTAINAYRATGTCPAASAIQLVNGHQPEVSCAATGSGPAVVPLNQPALAISAQAVAPERGIDIVGGAVSAVRGGVYSNSTINTTAGANLYAASPDRVVTRLGCTGGGTVGPAPCETVTGTYAPGADPNYATAVATAPTPFVSAPTCPSTEPVVFSPGTYNDRPALDAFMASCPRRTYHFPAAGGIGSPGVYYFDFLDDSEWTIPQGYTVVGGTFPAGVTGATVADQPVGSRCDDNAEGVQFLFGGGSRLMVKGAMEICAPWTDPTTTAPRVALFGVRVTEPVPVVTPATVSAKPATASSPSPFTPGTGALAANDGSVAVAPVPANATSAITVSGFDVSSIPDTAVITGASLAIRHSENESPSSTRPNFNKLDLQATATSGAAQAVVQSSACGSTPNCTRGLTMSPEMKDEPGGGLALPAGFRTKAALAALNVAYKATSSGSAYSASLDGVTLSVTYTPVVPVQPRWRAGSGCIRLVPYDPTTSSCALLTTQGSNAALAVKGTIYAPDAAVDIQLVTDAYQVFGRGLIVRTLRSNVTSSVPECNTVPPPDIDRCFPFQLPRGTVPAADQVVFTVKVDGATRLRSLVRFNGSAAPSVQSWTVVNEP